LDEVDVQAEEGSGGSFKMFSLIGPGLHGCILAQLKRRIDWVAGISLIPVELDLLVFLDPHYHPGH
jgi:hypothetical protein